MVWICENPERLVIERVAYCLSHVGSGESKSECEVPAMSFKGLWTLLNGVKEEVNRAEVDCAESVNETVSISY